MVSSEDDNDFTSAVRLRAVWTNRDNCFVRLSPQTAGVLRDQSMAAADRPQRRATQSWMTSVRKSRHNPHTWSIFEEEETSYSYTHAAPTRTIEFLPLSLQSPNGTILYASYNGGSCLQDEKESSSSGHIDLPTSLIPRNTAVEHEEGHDSSLPNAATEEGWWHVRALTVVDCARDLYVEPLSHDDWDLLEYHADWLETGGLLQQISVVYANQIVPLVLSSNNSNSRSAAADQARVRILSSNFEEAAGGSVWPGQETQACLRLVADTNVVIAPKPRTRSAPHSLRLVPTWSDCQPGNRNSSSISELAECLGVAAPCLATVDQLSAAVNPVTWKELQGSGGGQCIATIRIESMQQNGSASDLQSSCVVEVKGCVLVPVGSIALHPTVRWQIKASLFGCMILVTRISPFMLSKMARVLPHLVESGKLRLTLRKTQVGRDENVRPWRYPSRLNCSSTTCNSTEPQRLLDRNYLKSLFSTSSFPLSPKSVLSLAGIDEALSGHTSSLYQLTVEADDKIEAELSENPCIVFAKDLWTLVFLAPSEASDSFSKSPLLQKELPLFVDSLLPEKWFLSSSLSEFLKRAILYPRTFLYGDHGSGKTHTSLAVAAALQLKHGCKTLYLDCKKLRDSRVVRMATLIDAVAETIEQAAATAPCVLVLDDLDEISPSLDDSSPGSNDHRQTKAVDPVQIEQSTLMADVLCDLLRAALAESKYAIHLIVTCRAADSIPDKLATEMNFCLKAPVPTLETKDRPKLYHSFINCLALEKPNLKWNERFVEDFARKSVGFRPLDLQRLALRAISKPIHTAIEQATMEELQTFVPLTRLAARTEEQSQSLCWHDLGGLFQAKADLESTVVRPSKYHRIYQSARIKLPRGILLFGFPGCGKTLCVPALAHECGFPVIMCRGPELLDKYIGASEAKVRELFVRAAAAAPSILFLDELDALAPKRGSDSTGVTDRIVNQLLTFLDGVEDSASGGQVYIIASTSRPDKIDPALLRPGRLEKHVFFGMPQDTAELADIVAQISEDYSLDDVAKKLIVSDGFLQECMNEVQIGGVPMSAADIRALMNRAEISAVRDALSVDQTDTAALINPSHLTHAMRSCKPSLSKDDFLELNAIYSVYKKEKSSVKSSQPSDRALKVALK